MVDVENGCERVYIPYREIPGVVNNLNKIYNEYQNRCGVETHGGV